MLHTARSVQTTLARKIASGTCAALAIASLWSTASHAGTTSHVTFTETTPLSGNAEIGRRMISPLQAAAIPGKLAKANEAMADQPVDPSKETFTVYVPDRMPPGGYGLLVFMPPARIARVPDDWGAPLDERGFIFVAAARAGNDTSVLGRRVPLALIAEHNIAKRYKLNPDRIFVGGFSGGARVALRIALAYPDVFHGALMDEGADPIGTTMIPIPPKDLFETFQSSTRLVYVASDDDELHLEMDTASEQSLHDWCVFNVHEQIGAAGGHEAADRETVAKALDSLMLPATTDTAALSACRSKIDADLNAKLDQVHSLATSGQGGAARDLLNEIDAKYGGLAAPRTVELYGAAGL